MGVQCLAVVEAPVNGLRWVSQCPVSGSDSLTGRQSALMSVLGGMTRLCSVTVWKTRLTPCCVWHDATLQCHRVPYTLSAMLCVEGSFMSILRTDFFVKLLVRV